MFYYLYEVKNNLNQMIYIGVHKTQNINDDYMGSGKRLKNAIIKHGIKKFSKTILEFFNTPEEMFAKEKEIVTDSFLLRKDTYNIRRGGTGGFGVYHSQKAVKANRIRTQQRKIKYYESPKLCLKCSQQLTYKKRKNKFCSKSCATEYNNLIRGAHTEETKLKISMSLKFIPKTQKHKDAISKGRRKGILYRLNKSEFK